MSDVIVADLSHNIELGKFWKWFLEGGKREKSKIRMLPFENTKLCVGEGLQVRGRNLHLEG